MIVLNINMITTDHLIVADNHYHLLINTLLEITILLTTLLLTKRLQGARFIDKVWTRLDVILIIPFLTSVVNLAEWVSFEVSQLLYPSTSQAEAATEEKLEVETSVFGTTVNSWSDRFFPLLFTGMVATTSRKMTKRNPLSMQTTTAHLPRSQQDETNLARRSFVYAAIPLRPPSISFKRVSPIIFVPSGGGDLLLRPSTSKRRALQKKEHRNPNTKKKVRWTDRDEFAVYYFERSLEETVDVKAQCTLYRQVVRCRKMGGSDKRVDNLYERRHQVMSDFEATMKSLIGK